MKRIVCVGSRLVEADGAGPAVFDLLSSGPLPDGVEVVDGGLSGLSLLRAAEGAESVVFVDAVSGWGRGGEVLLLPAGEVAREAHADDHSGGLPFLLAVLPRACDAPPARVTVVGLETPWDAGSVARAATLAVEAATAVPSPGGARCS